ncbi:hypothetical protein UC34_25310 [Pandoraea vervacti]|uniref:Uncharacterized protein n=1 Tax=Pandoraea vervacti TaxID=656178 RepID=A0ABM6FR45_9BURK|nr:hypothetical protein [Pandoraea vervacti]APD11278.1 hypothetical protein UC34_25310 [Pandoraea vervacti]
MPNALYPAGATPTVTCPMHTNTDIGVLGQRLRNAVGDRPAPDQAWMPDQIAWDTLAEIASDARGLTEAEANVYRATLRSALPAFDIADPDVVLLYEVVDNCLGPGRPSITTHLAGVVFESLQLPHLVLLESGEAAPSTRTFNSVLPSLAAAAYDCGPFGRTLFLEGAATMLKGVNEACDDSRRERLCTTLFALPNPPCGGDAAPTNLFEFDAALTRLDVYEPWTG